MSARVCVVGGGPAGSTLATRLAQLGHDVTLVERKRFPRRRLGESLTPGVLPMLDVTGARAAVESAGFTRVGSVSVTWDGEPQERRDPAEEGLLVDRGRFDRLLLDRARALGVRVLQPARVVSRRRTTDGWALRVATRRDEIAVDAHVLADATGRGGFLRAARRPTGPRTIALHGYWRGDALPGVPSIEAVENAWCWGVPLPDGTYNTLVFVDAGALREMPKARLFRETLARTSLLEGGRNVRLVTGVLASDATPYAAADCVTHDSIAVGDAALALDPISSSGVQKAIQTSLTGALVVNTILRRPESAEMAMRFYRDRVADASSRHRGWATAHYALVARERDGPFWRDRAAGADTTALDRDPPSRAPLPPDLPLRVAPDTEFVTTPVAGAQVIESSPAIRHPGVDGPLAYLGGWEVAPLLRAVRPGSTALDIARTWSPPLPPDRALAIAAWLADRGVLVPERA